jgi:hypothetical protein
LVTATRKRGGVLWFAGEERASSSPVDRRPYGKLLWNREITEAVASLLRLLEHPGVG